MQRADKNGARDGPVVVLIPLKADREKESILCTVCMLNISIVNIYIL